MSETIKLIERSMVERVAMALFVARAWAAEGQDWAHVQECIREDYRRMARAAIEAMRLPTEKMVAVITIDRDVQGVVYMRGPDAYRAMIDEAFKS